MLSLHRNNKITKMRRWSIQKLAEWKISSRRKPLLLLGARQVGKTWLMLEFGKHHYQNIIYVRFDKDVYIKESFEKDFDTTRLLNNLHLHTGERITPGKTLILLDEIQECPAALTSLKYFCEDAPEQHIIAAGSLLGLEEHIGTGFPVGKVNRLHLYPMSFTEFMEACGYGRFVELLRSMDFDTISSFQSKYEDLLRTYYYVGGMPEVVSEYIKHGNMQIVRSVQEDLLSDYRNDFGKHATAAEQHLITEIWRHLPEQLAAEDKRFVAANVAPGIKSERLRGPIRWLRDAGLVSTVHRVRKPEIPLDAYADNAFKMFFLDVGLLSARCKLPASVLLEHNKVFSQYKGALTEQYVLQQLLADCELEPFYWAAERAQAEIDFLLQTDYGIIPIEVKAERNLRAKSLRSFCSRYGNKFAIRTSMGCYHSSQNNPDNSFPYQVVDLPLFAISSIRDVISSHHK